MSLKGFQAALSKAIVDKEISYQLETTLAHYSRQELEDRLGIYRNNFYKSLIDILKETFASVHAMLGDDCFQAITKAYVRQHPPKAAAMLLFGADYPAFLDSVEQLRELPYLAQLANLDWQHNLAYYAEEAQPLAPETFSSTPAHKLAEAYFELHPSCQFFQSNYAIYSLWQFALSEQPGADQLDINSREQGLFARPETSVDSYSLTHSTFQFLQHLHKGEPLACALEYGAASAVENEAPFNPGEAVAFLISSRLATRIKLPT